MKFSFDVEFDGILCGYSEISLQYEGKTGHEMIVKEENFMIEQSALETPFTTKFYVKYHIDPI